MHDKLNVDDICRKNKKFKILSIDGGGIRGIIPCKILAQLETELIKREGPEARLCDYFDLICGTSTGGIIAIGLALGLKASDILDLYVNHGNDIFPWFRRSNIHKLACFFHNIPYYRRDKLEEFLVDTYNKCTFDKDTRIGHAKTRLLVPVYNTEQGKIHVFKTAHHEKLNRDYQIPVVHIALATSAAPAYFEPYSFTYIVKGTSDEQLYKNLIDGGIVANNPSRIGLNEATDVLKVPLENISLLSLGTGVDRFTKSQSSSKMGTRFWANPINKKGLQIYEVMAAAQAEHVDNSINLMKANGFEYIRLQYVFNDNESIALDDASDDAISRLNSIAVQLYRNHGVEMENVFLKEKANKFEPLKTL